MKIFFVTPLAFPYGHASVNRIIAFAKGLLKNKLDVQVFCLNGTYGQRSRAVYGYVPYKGTFQNINYIYTSLSAYRARFLISRLLRRFVGVFIFYSLLLPRKTNDTILIYIGKMTFYTKIVIVLCKIKRMKIVLEVCEFPYEKGIITNEEYGRELHKLNQRAKMFDGFIFESDIYRDFFYNNFKLISPKNIIIPPSLEYADILTCEKTTSEQDYIAYCGSILSEDKDGIEFIIRSFAMIANLIPDCSLRMIGRIFNREYYRHLVNIIDRLQLSNKVAFSGEVDRHKYVYWLKNAKVLLLAKPFNSYHAGHSSKVVEYLFSGNPVVMVNSDSYANILEDNKDVLFVNKYDEQLFSQKILKAMLDIELRRQIGNAAVKKAKALFNNSGQARLVKKYLASL